MVFHSNCVPFPRWDTLIASITLVGGQAILKDWVEHQAQQQRHDHRRSRTDERRSLSSTNRCWEEVTSWTSAVIIAFLKGALHQPCVARCNTTLKATGTSIHHGPHSELDLGVLKSRETWSAFGIAVLLFGVIAYAGFSIFDLSSTLFAEGGSLNRFPT